MNGTTNQSTEIFDTMHKLERAGMSRTQAEITARAIDRQVSLSMQEVLDKIDARFDAHEIRYEARFQAIEKRLSWLYIESIVALCVIGAGFSGVIIALLHMA